ncbi:MAG: hypothetical protein ACOYOL_12085 [Chthoniobacterales bacterium]
MFTGFARGWVHASIGEIGHGLGSTARESGRDGGRAADDEVTLAAGLLAVLGAEGNADALLRVVGVVDGEVAPPRAIVVPDVVVGVEPVAGGYSC